MGVLPADVSTLLLDNADLDGCLAALNRCSHWYAHTVRGHVLSLQGHDHAAIDAFELAERCASSGTPDVPAIVAHHCYWAQHELVNGRDPGAAVSGFPLNPLRAMDSAISKMVDKIVGIDAARELAYGDVDRAAEMYNDLVARHNESTWHVGAAACALARGDDMEAERQLQLAELCAATTQYRLNAAKDAARLWAVHTYRKERSAAVGWQLFARRLRIPASTRHCLMRRAARLIEHSYQFGRLVVA